jgi:peptide/nickel transport system permease protein
LGAFIIRRLLWTSVLLFLISAVTFVIFNILPTGDAARLRAGRQQTPEQLGAIREQLGLNKPKLEQFQDYITGVFLHFDLQKSFINDEPVRTTLLDRAPATLMLVAGGAFIWFLSGLVIGTVSAVARGSLWDRLLMGGALVAISAPVYWLGLVVLYLFSDDIGAFNDFLGTGIDLAPFKGSGSYDSEHSLFQNAQALILPWFVIATAFAAIYARLLRSNLLETLSEDYIRTARAKGLSERRVVMRHGLRSAVTPIVTVLGLDIGILFGGAILTETVFNIPGVGRTAFEAIQRGDLMTIQGTTLFLALGVCVMSLIVDILYGFLDPRVRY